MDDEVAGHLNQDDEPKDRFTQDQKWESICVNVQFFQVILLGDFQNLGVFLLDLLDVSSFLETFGIFLLPLAHGLESGFLELLKSQPF